MTYIQGFLLAVPEANKEKYRDLAAGVAPVFRKHGALRMVEAWGVDVPDGKVTDFRRATKAQPDETVVFAFVEWPDRATCDAASARMQEEMSEMPQTEMPFDGMRMMWGGFETIFEFRE